MDIVSTEQKLIYKQYYNTKMHVNLDEDWDLHYS